MQNGWFEQIEILSNRFSSCNEIMFAYIHGSALHSTSPHDIDIAIFLFPEELENITRSKQLELDYLIPSELDLERLIRRKTDIQVLNRAPLGFRFRVVNSGTIILDRDPLFREQFELLSRVEYFDFRPRQKEYLREALR
jgi:predicted nucleotidyltransferase